MNRSRTGRLFLPAALILVACGALLADPPAQLASFRFLLGTWQAVGGPPGTTGGFTFAPSVQDHVIVRTNYSITAASGSTPASRHDDLMVIYADGGVVKADYFDNEGHVIRYVADAKAGSVTFVSEAKSSEPRYRLTYRRTSETTIDGTFEVAPPDKPDRFARYLSWTARKVK